MNNIVFSRVDHRLIHGQVITKWLKIAQASVIIIIDDYLGQDPFMLDIYKMAAPSGVKVDILTAEDAGKKFKEEAFSKEKTMFLFKNLDMVKKASSQGVKLKEIQLGGLPHEAEKKNVIPAISLSSQDMSILEELNSEGVDITAQVVPEESATGFTAIIKKYNS